MNKRSIFVFVCVLAVMCFFMNSNSPDTYLKLYHKRLNAFKDSQQQLISTIEKADLKSSADVERIHSEILESRKQLKGLDLWFRYLEPLAYKKINGPLPVEWETEVFEKFEKPYKREGAGLTLSALHLDELEKEKETLLLLMKQSEEAALTYDADSIINELKTYHHFYLCNRLFLLNLASIYTTGFECPDTAAVIPELRKMMADVKETYTAFNESFPDAAISREYLELYDKGLAFVNQQPDRYSHFNHFRFISEYINPLFGMNQQHIRKYGVITRSNMDYALNKNAGSIFSKNLYRGQNPKGIFNSVRDEAVLGEIDRLGKMLFFDPILSGNNQRSCASCHKPTEFFTDTLSRTSLQFDHMTPLRRNTPSLVNVGFNHLLMMDGKHISLQNQTKDVITNMTEMGATEEEVIRKVMSCKDYKKPFTRLLKYTPTEKEVTMDHITSAITFFYSKFSLYDSPFDEAVNLKAQLDSRAIAGFNVFMSKAQCATCHFVPQFNGVKPPYVGSEFEVIGVPSHEDIRSLSLDKGRYEINQADETRHAFRTGTVRNAKFTRPYMHNGIFSTLEEVIDFYDAGGGAGRGLDVPNQTLSSDSLRLSRTEKENLIRFIESLNEKVTIEQAPEKLPLSSNKVLNKRTPGGNY